VPKKHKQNSAARKQEDRTGVRLLWFSTKASDWQMLIAPFSGVRSLACVLHMGTQPNLCGPQPIKKDSSAL